MAFDATADATVIGKEESAGAALPDFAPILSDLRTQGFYICPQDSLAVSDDGNASYRCKLSVELQVQPPVQPGDKTTTDGKRDGFNPLRAKASTVAAVAAFLRSLPVSGLTDAQGNPLPEDANNGVRAAAVNRMIVETLKVAGVTKLSDLDRTDAYIGVVKPWPKRTWAEDLAAYDAR